MKPSAVLLIDLENFYLSRVQHFDAKSVPPAARPAFAKDMERLIAFAQRMAGAPFAVRRAYADYSTLKSVPRDLMRQGVEPVQVFRLSGTRAGNKNAADMRMAMDATALLASAGHAEQFVLVTGDADFIPVILELKRHGRAVSVIGVTGATNELIQRFVDNFELFEDLLAAEEVESRSGELPLTGDGMEKVAAAIRRLLSRNRPLRFAAVKPLLSKELDYPFDPGVFGCDTTGDFLRQFATELGVVIRQGQHDSEIDLPGLPSHGVNGTNGLKIATGRGAKQPDRPALKPPHATTSLVAAPEPHTAAHYRLLLAGRGQPAGQDGTVKLTAVPWPVLEWACDAVATLLAPPAGEPTHTTSLLAKLLKAAEGAPVPELVKHLRLFYPILRAGLPGQGAEGIYALPAHFTGEQVRQSVLGYIGGVLNSRLAESGVHGAIRPEALAAVFEPGAALELATAEMTAALARPAPAPTPEPARTPKPLLGAEETHTAVNYSKLLKAGGTKGSETESLKVLPVPWPSVERVCADAFPLLCPGAGGGPLPRDQLNARLCELGKDFCVEPYPQHVRRVLGILRVAGDLSEENGSISLNVDITSAQELRNHALGFLLQLLQLRLEEREQYDPIRPQAFVAALEAGPMTDRLIEEVAPAIAWLYKPDGDDKPVADAAADVALTPAETAAGELRRPQPGTDSGVVEVGMVSHAGATGPIVSTDPAGAGTAPVWEPYTFDGVLPDDNHPVEVDFDLSSTGEAQPPAESPSMVFGVVDVAAITSEAVAAATVEPAAGAAGASSVHLAQPVEPTPDSLMFATPAAFPTTPGPNRGRDEEIFGAVPVADWLPEGDPLFSDPHTRPTATGTPLPSVPVHPPPPPFAKITPPPPQSPPPESA